MTFTVGDWVHFRDGYQDPQSGSRTGCLDESDSWAVTAVDGSVYATRPRSLSVHPGAQSLQTAFSWHDRISSGTGA